MTKAVNIIEDDDTTLTVYYHDNGDVSWQLDVCAIDDLPITAAAAVESCRAAARYLRSMANELDAEARLMEQGK